jgi:hypothetical protein
MTLSTDLKEKVAQKAQSVKGLAQDAVSGGGSSQSTPPLQDPFDLERLAELIVKKLLEELTIETERTGKF